MSESNKPIFDISMADKVIVQAREAKQQLLSAFGVHLAAVIPYGRVEFVLHEGECTDIKAMDNIKPLKQKA